MRMKNRGDEPEKTALWKMKELDNSLEMNNRRGRRDERK